jgi:DNA-binding transcriptional MocR family regulator
VSWKALDWATDSEVGSSTTKFILLLLANKADENFSCYPSIRTLMAESGAGRGTVMRALKELTSPTRPHAPARPPSPGAANAKTNDRAPSRSPCPTAPKQLRSAPAAARKRTEKHMTHIPT